MSKLEHIYLKLPFFVQRILINVQGLKIKSTRYNKQFKQYLIEYQELGARGSQFIGDYQREKLSEFLKIAAKSNYWYNKFQEYNVNPEATDVYNEIQKLPVLKKSEVKANVKGILISSDSDKILPIKTSGTTGSGLSFYQSDEMLNRQWAIWWRYRSWHGIDEKTWCGWFGGKVVIRSNRKNIPYWHVNYPGRQLMFSPIHLNDNTVKQYYNELVKRKIPWLHGYPSQLTLLATLCEKNNLMPWKDLKVITIGAENLYLHQKEILERVFKVPVRQHYGLSEGVANISEDANGELKPDDEFCYTEFIKIENSNNLYRIVGTNFSNHVFPLLRYDTGDIVSISYSDDEKITIESIEGRSEDYLTLPDGGRLGPFNLIMKEFTNVFEAQLVQVNKDKILLRVVKGTKYSEHDEKKINAEINRRLTCKVDFNIEYINSIPKTANGKLRGVISEIKDSKIDSISTHDTNIN